MKSPNHKSGKGAKSKSSTPRTKREGKVDGNVYDKKARAERRKMYDVFGEDLKSCTEVELQEKWDEALRTLGFMCSLSGMTAKGLAHHIGRCESDMSRFVNKKLPIGSQVVYTVIGFLEYLHKNGLLWHPCDVFLDPVGVHAEWLPREAGASIDAEEVIYHGQHDVALIQTLRSHGAENIARLLEQALAMAKIGGLRYKTRMVQNAFLSFYTVFTNRERYPVTDSRLKIIFDSFIPTLLHEARQGCREEDLNVAWPMTLSLAGALHLLMGQALDDGKLMTAGDALIDEAFSTNRFEEHDFGVDHARNTWETLEQLCEKEHEMRAKVAATVEKVTNQEMNAEMFKDGRERCEVDGVSTTPNADAYVKIHYPKLWQRLVLVIIAIVGAMLSSSKCSVVGDGWSNGKEPNVQARDGRGTQVGRGIDEYAVEIVPYRLGQFGISGRDGRAAGKG